MCACKHGYRQLKFPLACLDEIQRMPHNVHSLSDKLRTRAESQIKSSEDKKEKRKKKSAVSVSSGIIQEMKSGAPGLELN